MKKNNNKLIIIIISLLTLTVLGTVYFIFKKDSYSLTVADNNYLNKIGDTVIDISYPSDYPVYSNEKAVFEDFLAYLEKATNISLNKISYSKGNKPSSEYVIDINNTSKLTKDELLINEDPYIVFSKEDKKVNNILELNGAVGLLASDFDDVSYHLSDNKSISFSTKNTADELITALESGELKYIVLPNIMYLDKLESKNINRSIALSNKVNNIVFKLSKDKKNEELNKIFTKVFYSWKEENFVELYNKSLMNNYIEIHGALDKDKSDFLSKVYTYGYVKNSPYELNKKGEIAGLAGEYIERFKRFSGSEIEMKEYKSLDELFFAIKKGDIDIYFNMYNLKSPNYNEVPSTFEEKLVVLAKKGSTEVVTNLSSLKDKKVNALKYHGTTIHLKNNSKADIKEKAELKDLVENENLIVIDYEIYLDNQDKLFKDYDVAYLGLSPSQYSFMVLNKHSLFTNLLSFTVNSNSYAKYRNMALRSLNSYKLEIKNLKDAIWVVALIILVPLISSVFIYYSFKKRNEIKRIDRENRHKYTDVLTGLKNRNYLNLNSKYWNKTNKYPQSVILLDLNNINYVNDNYGYEEGDKLIKSAASVLIATQLENSEIIRTDGNEFMIYLVGYTEKQTEVYVKKLKKEMKKLPYKFGAGIGYSMIFDEIKTIDDAITEALLAVKIDKEDKE